MSERNKFEWARRIDKAWKLAAILQEHGATPEQAAGLSLKGRMEAAVAAGVRPPSDKTWALTVQYLANRLRAHQKLSEEAQG